MALLADEPEPPALVDAPRVDEHVVRPQHDRAVPERARLAQARVHEGLDGVNDQNPNDVCPDRSGRRNVCGVS